MKKIKIALCQLLIEGGEADRNFKRTDEILKTAKQANADIALLPECMDFGWTHPEGLKSAEPIPGKYANLIAEYAKKYSIYICAGLTERSRNNNKNYNTAILVNNKGEIILKYRKINILEKAFDFYEIGQKLEVVNTDFGKIGINICSDNYRDAIDIGFVLGRMGADIILSPSSWTVDHNVVESTDPYSLKWEEPFSIIAKIFKIPIISTTSVGYIVGGPFEGKKMVGCSLALNHNGILVKSDFNEFASDIKFLEIELENKKIKGTQIGPLIKKEGYLK
jgi:predicted amidohydrolase